jgi:hypothetical protein
MGGWRVNGPENNLLSLRLSIVGLYLFEIFRWAPPCSILPNSAPALSGVMNSRRWFFHTQWRSRTSTTGIIQLIAAIKISNAEQNTM